MKDILGLRRIVLATRYSAEGLIAAVKGEAAFRQELALAVVLVPLGIWLGEDGTQRALLAGSVLLVLVVELLNSGLEAAVDRVSEERHPLAKRAKDLGSAAVMLSLAAAALVWLLVLF
jgi:diacylglycerol kinase (ATP)